MKIVKPVIILRYNNTDFPKTAFLEYLSDRYIQNDARFRDSFSLMVTDILTEVCNEYDYLLCYYDAVFESFIIIGDKITMGNDVIVKRKE